MIAERHIHKQDSAYSSPWSQRQRLMLLIWEYSWLFLCSWTPKPANRWRIFLLQLFGATIYGKPFVHQRAQIQVPWNLIMHDRACLGDRANAYSLGKVEIHEHATVAQEAYLCTGTHAFNEPAMNLITAPIVIGKHAFIGARAFIMPGLTIGEYAIVGACSVVTKDITPYSIVAGNPAQGVSIRNIPKSAS
jgi:putative colanic acid biosynthesis acetyltransferase WcaF